MNDEQSNRHEPAGGAYMNEGKYATREEVIEAIRGLTDEDHQKLVLISRFWHRQRQLIRLGLDPLEVLSEAYESTLAGLRKWRKARVTLVQHLDQSMRSISGHHLEKAQTITTAKKEARGIALVSERSPRASAVEARTEARIEIEAIRTAFSDDPGALRVLECRADGKTADEIQVELSLTKTEYETINRRILRTFTKFSLKG
jgi:hypothetical protein